MAPKAGRRGTKRKADAVQEEEEKVVELKKEKEAVKESGSEESILWTGIKKGPPRKLKFPEPAVVVAALEEALKAPQ
ncbi:unnamed protein product [Lota lota]